MKTERNVRTPEEAGDTIPEQAGVYIPPRPVASLSEHRTMDVKAIRLAAEVDPRQALTELRLQAPPLRRKSPWLAPLALASLALGFIGVWWITPGPLPLQTEPAPSEPMVAPELGPRALPPPVATAAPLPSPAVAARELPDSARPPVAAAPSSSATAPVPAAHPSAKQHPKPARDPWLE